MARRESFGMPQNTHILKTTCIHVGSGGRVFNLGMLQLAGSSLSQNAHGRITYNYQSKFDAHPNWPAHPTKHVNIHFAVKSTTRCSSQQQVVYIQHVRTHPPTITQLLTTSVRVQCFSLECNLIGIPSAQTGQPILNFSIG